MYIGTIYTYIYTKWWLYVYDIQQVKMISNSFVYLSVYFLKYDGKGKIERLR